MRSAIPDWLLDWARNRKRGAKGRIRIESATNRDGINGIGPRPAWLEGTDCGISTAIERASLEPWSPAAEARLCSALAMIPADLGYDAWFRYGMALCDL